MRIAIDVETTQVEKVGHGIYVWSLVSELEKIGRHTFLLLTPSRAAQSRLGLKTPQRWLWDQVIFPWRAWRRGADLIHQPAFSVPILFPGKKVVTVHDLIPIYFGKDISLPSRLFLGKWVPFTFRFADHLIAVSKATKQDLIDTLNIPEEKITVIPEAAGESFKPVNDPKERDHIKKKYGISMPYLLHIGTINPRKNLEFLVRVFAKLVQNFPTLSLIITGKKGWYYDDLFRLIDELKLHNKIIFTGYIDEQDKPALISGASVYCFPSLYEGFGLPALEAMACGTPVVASNISSIPEVTGKAAILVSPHNEQVWIEAIRRILTDTTLAARMRKEGLSQAKKFSWKKAAHKTMKVYEQVAGIADAEDGYEDRTARVTDPQNASRNRETSDA
jgi:glycosyltransferase involved in cell wall biosynthesis